MLRHSSPRQVRKYRREQNLQKRIGQWSAILAKYGDAGIAYARKHGVEVNGALLNTDHLPGVPLDFPNGLEVASGTTTGRSPTLTTNSELQK